MNWPPSLRSMVRASRGRGGPDRRWGLRTACRPRLLWAAVNHHNTDNPHVHIVVRGVDQDGNGLRIDGPYIARGMRRARGAGADASAASTAGRIRRCTRAGRARAGNLAAARRVVRERSTGVQRTGRRLSRHPIRRRLRRARRPPAARPDADAEVAGIGARWAGRSRSHAIGTAA
jgi:type IV secretory pathway VirD2 relaxase